MTRATNEHEREGHRHGRARAPHYATSTDGHGHPEAWAICSFAGLDSTPKTRVVLGNETDRKPLAADGAAGRAGTVGIRGAAVRAQVGDSATTGPSSSWSLELERVRRRAILELEHKRGC